MYDWNHDGKIDYKDHMIDYQVYKATSNQRSSGKSPKRNDDNSGCGTCLMAIFIVFAVIGLFSIIGSL